MVWPYVVAPILCCSVTVLAALVIVWRHRMKMRRMVVVPTAPVASCPPGSAPPLEMDVVCHLPPALLTLPTLPETTPATAQAPSDPPPSFLPPPPPVAPPPPPPATATVASLVPEESNDWAAPAPLPPGSPWLPSGTLSPSDPAQLPVPTEASPPAESHTAILLASPPTSPPNFRPRPRPTTAKAILVDTPAPASGGPLLEPASAAASAALTFAVPLAESASPAVGPEDLPTASEAPIATA
ncbi:hypothetical protein PAPYR_7920 [Paratrimastix pyriformis]|uniref:Uncharacterized protein n=1 Tax=Paratrimastix pyriformis TaxID=342808 RepID=A0ABQ8UBY4_9EUKA|nr:hypothetical protein PAPYR_7920 [Paratrimastix pyriformis]